jgi:DNA-binding response OmpR family regulator
MEVLRRVLVVEDDVDLAKLSQLKLSELGYDVQLCHSARQAQDAAKTFRPDVILLDVMLGDGIGYQVARAVRQDPLLYRTPVLFQSLLTEPREIEHAYHEGADGYLTKPYTLQTLSGELQKMQRISENCEARCPLTGLHYGVRLRREIDHRLLRGDTFALFYLMMEGLTVHHQRVQHKRTRRHRGVDRQSAEPDD